NAQIGVAIAAFFPSVTLGASGGFESRSVAQWFTWPSRVWSVGPTISQTVFGGFQEVEDNLAALRILEDEATAQAAAVKAAEQALSLITDQYKAGTVSYLNVIVAQATALSNEITAVQILGRQMVAAALLVKALGGGWSADNLPETHEFLAPDRPTGKDAGPSGLPLEGGRSVGEVGSVGRSGKALARPARPVGSKRLIYGGLDGI